MGGLITTAARFKDGVSTSFRHYTGNYFHLTFDESEFKRQMKKGCPSSRISPKRKYIHLSTEAAVKKYETEFSKTENNYVYGNNFLAPVWYGINFYDYKNKVAFSVNDHSNILHYPAYTLMANPVMQEILKNKDKYHFSENNLNRWSHNIPSDILFDFYKFKELKNLNALYDLDGNQLDLSHVDTIEALIGLFDEDRFLHNKYASLPVKLSEWKLFYGDKLKDYQQLYEYLIEENLLSKNDMLAWDLFMSNYDEKYIFHFLTKLSEEELYPFFSNKYASLKDNDKKTFFSSFINKTYEHKLPQIKNRYTSLSSFVIETLEKDFDLFKPLFDKIQHLWLKLAYSFVFNSKLPVEIKDIMLKNNALSHFKMIEFIKTLDPFYINTNQELFSILIENKQLHPNQIKHMFFKELSRDIYGSYDFLEMFIKITGNEKSFILNDLFDYTLSSEISIKNRILNKYLTSEYIINNQEKIISLLIKDDISFFNKNKFVKNIISTLAINTDKIVFKMLYASMSIKYFEKLITNEPLIFKKQNIIELQNTYPNFYQHFYLNNKIFALSKKQHLYSLFSSLIIKSEFSDNNINKSLLIKNRL